MICTKQDNDLRWEKIKQYSKGVTKKFPLKTNQVWVPLFEVKDISLESSDVYGIFGTGNRLDKEDGGENRIIGLLKNNHIEYVSFQQLVDAGKEFKIVEKNNHLGFWYGNEISGKYVGMIQEIWIRIQIDPLRPSKKGGFALRRRAGGGGHGGANAGGPGGMRRHPRISRFILNQQMALNDGGGAALLRRAGGGGSGRLSLGWRLRPSSKGRRLSRGGRQPRPQLPTAPPGSYTR